MNFINFQAWREQTLRDDPGLLDCGETNLYRALAAWRPQLDVADEGHAHRCDLARLWLTRYGFDAALSRNALVCCGVRHALELIFKILAAEGDATIRLPQDIYPVYGELARQAGLAPSTYATLPVPLLPPILPAPAPAPSGLSCGEYLLIANPWKPLGRYLNEKECSHLVRWLEASPSRHLLIDAVYDLAVPFHETTRRLYATGRAVLLHSLSKGWLHPKIFGIALIGENVTHFAPIFRNHPPTQDSLRLAHALMTKAADLPSRIELELNRRSCQWMEAIPDQVRERFAAPVNETEGGYFFPVEITAMDLLQRHRIVGVPASAFGAVNWHGSILTNLSAAFT